jgi:hypothetical protein
VEDQTVVERFRRRLAGGRIGEGFRALREADEILDGLGRLFVMEFDDEVAFTRREMCVNAGISCHDKSSP